MQDYEYSNNVKAKDKPKTLAYEIQKLIFQIGQSHMEGFWKKTLNNMLLFWFKLGRCSIINNMP